jgi:HAD superfamily hydrolase (TIGR01549 family)
MRAILFDLDGTLRFNRPSALDAFFQFCAELGLALDAEARCAVERWTHAFWSGKHNGVAHSAPDPAQFWLSYTRGLLEAVGVQDQEALYTPLIVRAFDERYLPQPYVPEEAHQVLRALRGAGWTLGLVSNRQDDLAPLAAELGLSEYFHFTLSGGQANSWKPDARIFLLACELAHAAPCECLYVGDNYYADVVGAQAAGLTPVLLDPRDVFANTDCLRIVRLGDLLPMIP